MMLTPPFFNRDALIVAKELLGKEIRVFTHEQWLSAIIVETEAYFLEDKASHASLGFTEKRKALFMPAGTIYMYYARGGDSLNVSCRGAGNAVLIKAGRVADDASNESIELMQRLNPISGRMRDRKRLCSGQTLLCRSLNLKVPEWDQQDFDPKKFYMRDISYTPKHVIQTTRLGIPTGRDEDLPYRFIDAEYSAWATAKKVAGPLIGTNLTTKLLASFKGKKQSGAVYKTVP